MFKWMMKLTMKLFQQIVLIKIVIAIKNLKVKIKVNSHLAVMIKVTVTPVSNNQETATRVVNEN